MIFFNINNLRSLARRPLAGQRPKMEIPIPSSYGNALALWNPPSVVHYAEFHMARCFGSAVDPKQPIYLTINHITSLPFVTN